MEDLIPGDELWVDKKDLLGCDGEGINGIVPNLQKCAVDEEVSQKTCIGIFIVRLL